jgi:hypothetical protein
MISALEYTASEKLRMVEVICVKSANLRCKGQVRVPPALTVSKSSFVFMCFVRSSV